MTTTPERTGAWIPLAAIFLLLALAGFVAVSGIRSAGRYPNLRVEAEPYRWPKGCPEASYALRDTIPKSCSRAGKYRLRNATELGLVTTGRNTRWHRVGDDALMLYCATWGKYCDIRQRVPGKFVRFGYSRSLNEAEAAKTAA